MQTGTLWQNMDMFDAFSLIFFSALYISVVSVCAYVSWDDYCHLVVKNKIIYPAILVFFLGAGLWDSFMAVSISAINPQALSMSSRSSVSSAVGVVFLSAVFFGLVFGMLYFFAQILTSKFQPHPLRNLEQSHTSRYFLGLGDVKYAIFLGQCYGIMMYLNSSHNDLISLIFALGIFVYLMIMFTFTGAVSCAFIGSFLQECTRYFLCRKSYYVSSQRRTVSLSQSSLGLPTRQEVKHQRLKQHIKKGLKVPVPLTPWMSLGFIGALLAGVP